MRPLDALRHVGAADVYKAGVRAATLCRTESGVEFAYREDFSGLPVATSLPVGEGPVLAPAGALPPFFTGLLPEGRRLSALRRAVKTSLDDELTLLLAVGGNLVGDVQVVPEGEAVEAVTPVVTIGDSPTLRFSALLADEFRGPVDRAGLAGVQDKVSAAMIALPVRRRHEEYILKLDPPEFPHLVANEALMLEAARLSGVSAVDAAVVEDSEGRQGLLVRRFDRTASGPLAVEDGCQVLRRVPRGQVRRHDGVRVLRVGVPMRCTPGGGQDIDATGGLRVRLVQRRPAREEPVDRGRSAGCVADRPRVRPALVLRVRGPHDGAVGEWQGTGGHRPGRHRRAGGVARRDRAGGRAGRGRGRGRGGRVAASGGGAAR